MHKIKWSLICFFISTFFFVSVKLFAQEQNTTPVQKTEEQAVKEKVELSQEAIANAMPAYNLNLKELIDEAQKNIRKVDEEINKQEALKRNQERETKVREHFEQGNASYAAGKLTEAKEHWSEALKHTQDPEMKGYIQQAQIKSTAEAAAKRKQELEEKSKAQSEAREKARLEAEAARQEESAKIDAGRKQKAEQLRLEKQQKEEQARIEKQKKDEELARKKAAAGEKNQMEVQAKEQARLEKQKQAEIEKQQQAQAKAARQEESAKIDTERKQAQLKRQTQIKARVEERRRAQELKKRMKELDETESGIK